MSYSKGSSSSTEDARMSLPSSTDDGDPYAINGVHFNRDMFISKIVQVSISCCVGNNRKHFPVYSVYRVCPLQAI